MSRRPWVLPAACLALTTVVLGGVFALTSPYRTGVIVGGPLIVGRTVDSGEPSDLPTAVSPPAVSPPVASPTPSASSSASGQATSPSPVGRAVNPAARPASVPKVVPPPPPAGNLATRLTRLPNDTTQVIIVHAPGSASATATLEAFDKRSGQWQPAFAAMSAAIGSRGFSDAKREGDGTTPVGMYGIGATMYGLAPDPGVAYPYHQVVENDWWNGNPATAGYNTFVHGDNPGAASESLWTHTGSYTHFAVINYNTPAVAADPPRGSAIFLHQRGAGPTAGCVALAAGDLDRILTWLQPGASPRIVLGPDQALPRF